MSWSYFFTVNFASFAFFVMARESPITTFIFPWKTYLLCNEKRNILNVVAKTHAIPKGLMQKRPLLKVSFIFIARLEIL